MNKTIHIIGQYINIYNTYINIDEETNDKDPKFKVGVYLRITKYKKTFLLKAILQTGLKKVL